MSNVVKGSSSNISESSKEKLNDNSITALMFTLDSEYKHKLFELMEYYDHMKIGDTIKLLIDCVYGKVIE